jgi:hypothetical protein
MQRQREYAHPLHVTCVEGGLHGVEEVGTKSALLVAQLDILCRVLHRAFPVAVDLKGFKLEQGRR